MTDFISEKNKAEGDGKIARESGGCTALANDLNLVPSTHIRLTASRELQLQRIQHPFLAPADICTHMSDTHIHMNKNS